MYCSYFLSHLCILWDFQEKKKFNFVFKIIYLSTHFSYVGLGVRLDYDGINTILLILYKISLNFPFVLLVTIIIYRVITNTFLGGNNDIFLLRYFKMLLKILNLIMHWIFGLITSRLKCFTYSEEEIWLWCDFYFSLSFFEL